MIKRNTGILLIVFLVLIAAMLLIQKMNLFVPQATATATAIPSLLAEDDPIIELKLTDQNGLAIDAKIGADSQWVITQPANLQISQENMQEVLSDFYGISVQSSMSSSFSLEATGLDTPTYTFSLTLKSGQTKILKIGLLTPTQSGYYVSLDSGVPVIVLQANVDNITELLKAVTYTPTPTITILTPANTSIPTFTTTETMVTESPTP